MSPELEQLLISKLGNKQQSLTFQDRMGQLADELRNRDLGSRLEASFMQTLKNSELGMKKDDFNMSLKGEFNKGTLATAFGASVAGQVGGLVTRLIPVNLGIAGVPAIIGGYALKKYMLKAGTGADVAEGVMIGGIAVAISGFTGNFNLGTIVGGTSTQTGSTGSNVVF